MCIWAYVWVNLPNTTGSQMLTCVSFVLPAGKTEDTPHHLQTPFSARFRWRTLLFRLVGLDFFSQAQDLLWRMASNGRLKNLNQPHLFSPGSYCSPKGFGWFKGTQICLSSGSSDNFFQPKVSQVSWSGQMRDVLVQGGGMQLLSNTTLRQQRQQSKRYRFLDDLLGRKLIFNAFQPWEEIPCGKIPSLESKIFITYIFHQIVKNLPDLLMWHNCHFVSEKMRHDGLSITSPTKAGH